MAKSGSSDSSSSSDSQPREEKKKDAPKEETAKTLHVGNLTRNVNAAHLEEIFGAPPVCLAAPLRRPLRWARAVGAAPRVVAPGCSCRANPTKP